jgi:Tfp pilus assembly protein PilN
MRASVTHINLLQRTAPAHTAAWALVVLLTGTLVAMLYYGNHVRSIAQQAEQRRDDATLQLKQMQARMAAVTGEQAKNADAIAFRKEIDALQPQAQAAQALMDAVRTDGGQTQEFARTLTAMTGVNEPGLWLTTLTVSAGGKKLELQGEARSGAAVLRFARRANESLQPLTLRLDSLEMQPAAAGAAPGAGAVVGAVSFRLY